MSTKKKPQVEIKYVPEPKSPALGYILLLDGKVLGSEEAYFGNMFETKEELQQTVDDLVARGDLNLADYEFISVAEVTSSKSVTFKLVMQDA